MVNESTIYDMTTNIQHSAFAVHLRQCRVRKNLSIWSAAAHSGVDPAVIYDYENDRATPKIEDLKKLASCYGVSVAEIFSSCQN